MSIDKKFVTMICNRIVWGSKYKRASRIYMLNLYARGRSKEDIDFIESAINTALNGEIVVIPDEEQYEPITIQED